MENLSDRLEKLLEDRGWDAPKLAAEMRRRCGRGVSKTAVYDWLKGKGVREANLRCLAEVFGVSMSYLRDGEGGGAAPLDRQMYLDAMRAVLLAMARRRVTLPPDQVVNLTDLVIKIAARTGGVDQALTDQLIDNAVGNT